MLPKIDHQHFSTFGTCGIIPLLLFTGLDWWNKFVGAMDASGLPEFPEELGAEEVLLVLIWQPAAFRTLQAAKELPHEDFDRIVNVNINDLEFWVNPG